MPKVKIQQPRHKREGKVMANKVGKPNTAQQKSVSQYEETKRSGAYPNRQAPGDAVEAGPERVRAARKAHHGASTNADGSSFATPLRKTKTNGGNK
jgi:hypothetical protein